MFSVDKSYGYYSQDKSYISRAAGTRRENFIFELITALNKTFLDLLRGLVCLSDPESNASS